MAKKKIKKGFGRLIDKIKTQQDQIEKFTSDTNEAVKFEDRLKKLESELKQSFALVSSQIAINKELISRLQPIQQADKVDTDALAPPSKEDSSAAILGKIFAFWKHNAEEDDKQEDKQRRKAKETASENRSKNTSTAKKTATKQDLAKPSSNPILTIIQSIIGGVTGLVGFLSGGLVGLLRGGIEVLFGGLASILRALPGGGFLGAAAAGAGNIASGAVGLVGDAFAGIAGGLAGFLNNIIVPLIYKVITGVMASLGGVLSSIFSALPIGTTLLKGILGRLGPAGLVASLGLTAYSTYKGADVIGQEAEKEIYGDDVSKLTDEINLQHKIMTQGVESTGRSYSPENKAKAIKEAPEKYKNAIIERNSAYLKSFDEIAESAKAAGYEPSEEIQKAPDGFWNDVKQFTNTLGSSFDIKKKETKVIGFRNKETGEFVPYARVVETPQGPYLDSGVDRSFADTAKLVAAKVTNRAITNTATSVSQFVDNAVKDAQSTLSPTATPAPTANPAPSEKPESDNTAVAPQVAQPQPAPATPAVSPMSIKPADESVVSSEPQVIIAPDNVQSVTQGKKEKRASPQLRNPALEPFTKRNFGMAP